MAVAGLSVWTQTMSGRALVFAEPEITREHLFGEIAHGLATVNRYAGQLLVPLSVAQHCVLMADAALDETGDVELAAFCLLHDAHEAYLGDLPSPAIAAIGEAMAADAVDAGLAPLTGYALGKRHERGVARVKRTLDRAIVEAASLSSNRFEARAEEIHDYDVRMLRTERDLLMAPPPRRWFPAVEAARRLLLRRNPKLKSWAWPEAEERYRDALTRLCPESTRPATVPT